MQIDVFGGHFENSPCIPFPLVNFGKTFDMYFIRGYTDRKDQKMFSCHFLYIDPTKDHRMSVCGEGVSLLVCLPARLRASLICYLGI